MDAAEPPIWTTRVTTGEEREALAANDDDMTRNKEERMIERGFQSSFKAYLVQSVDVIQAAEAAL